MFANKVGSFPDAIDPERVAQVDAAIYFLPNYGGTKRKGFQLLGTL